MNQPATTEAMAAMRRSLRDAVSLHTVGQVLARRALEAHYQPIVQLRNGVIMGYESLIRGPTESALRRPDALFQAARIEGLTVELEEACLRQGLRGWGTQAQGTRLFLNLSARTIVVMVERMSVSGVLKALQAAAVSPASLVIEVTEHEHIDDLPQLIEVASALRCEGLRFALDDFGDGRSSLRL